MRLTPENPMNRAMAATLVCQAIVFALAFPGMVMVSNVSVLMACLGTVVPVLLCLAGCARLRRPEGYPLGWLAQLSGILMGLLTPMMYAVGVMFAVIWTASFVMGRRLEGLQKPQA